MIFKGAIFDLDGTLLESLHVWSKIDADFLGKRNIEVPKSYSHDIAALSFVDIAHYTKKLFSLEDSIEDMLTEWNSMAIYEYSHNVKLKPNVLEYLEYLKKHHIKIALATSSSKVLYEPALKNNGIYDIFDTFCGAEDVKRGKEFPDIFLLAAKRLGLPPGDCIVFEDLLQGIKSAQSAGMITYGVFDKFCKYEPDEIKSLADGYIYGFADAPRPFR